MLTGFVGRPARPAQPGIMQVLPAVVNSTTNNCCMAISSWAVNQEGTCCIYVSATFGNQQLGCAPDRDSVQMLRTVQRSRAGYHSASAVAGLVLGTAWLASAL